MVDGKLRPRIFMWDTLDGSLAHEITTSGPISKFHLSPNERFLVAQVDGPNLTTLDGWRLDGREMKISGDAPRLL